MRVFVDTNVFLDLLWRRESFLADSLKVFDLAVDGKIELLISDLSIANIKYITRKDYSVAYGLDGLGVLVHLTCALKKRQAPLVP